MKDKMYGIYFRSAQETSSQIDIEANFESIYDALIADLLDAPLDKSDSDDYVSVWNIDDEEGVSFYLDGYAVWKTNALHASPEKRYIVIGSLDEARELLRLFIKDRDKLFKLRKWVNDYAKLSVRSPSIFESEKIQREKQNPFHLIRASEEGDLEEVKRLIREGVDVNQRSPGGTTPIMGAVAFNRIEVAQYLISQGADLSIRDGFGEGLLDTAEEYPEMLELLKKSGAK